MRMILWHGSDRRISRFLDEGRDRALHLGTMEQARMRNGRYLHEVEVDLSHPRRSRDRGGDWSGRIRSARAAGADAIIYLNRYEGLDATVISRLNGEGRLDGLDRLTDRAFQRLVPEARDSLIILDPSRARIIKVLEGGPSRLEPECEIKLELRYSAPSEGPDPI